MARRAKQYLIDYFSINVNAYDLIIGYRADDSYFDYAESFLNNTISVEQLAQAMRLGKLGEQIVIKSQFAFSNLKFEGYEVADKNQYYDLRKARNDEANQYYLKMLDQEMDGLFIQDIIRGGITMMIHAYQEIYVNNAQTMLGDAFDYAINTCHISGDDFVKMFVVSSFSERIEMGSLRVWRVKVASSLYMKLCLRPCKKS